VQSLKNGKRRELFPGRDAWYSPAGHIIYFENDFTSLSAVRFDLSRLEVKGTPVHLKEGVIGASLSESGTFACVLQPENTLKTDSNVSSDITTQGRTLWWVDMDGKEELIPADPNMYSYPHISPDGNKVALMVGPGMGGADVWIYDLIRETPNRLNLLFG
jgi:Tol biopolymer transport system component